MDFRYSPEDEALRRDAMDFVQREWDPKGYDTGIYALRWHHGDPRVDSLIKEFEKKLVSKGWYTMHWPEEYGGQGVSISTQLAFREAMGYAGAPAGLGGGLVAPVLMAIGQDWQKRDFLPPVSTADLGFSQGFSEPNAGSDLASLETRAVRDGDDYRITGQKIWGTYREDWLHILVRTDPDAPKHRGITYLLMPLKDDKGEYLPGITVRAIYDALGRFRWDELYLDDVRVPARNVVGEENRGFYAAMTTLSFERSNIDRVVGMVRVIEQFLDFCRDLTVRTGQSPMDSPVNRNQLANWRLEVEVARMISYRVAWLQSRGEIPTREASMVKAWNDRNIKGIYGFLSRILGPDGNLLPGGSKQMLPLNGYINSSAFLSGTLSLAGGTTEIQKNIIAQRGLGLPR